MGSMGVVDRLETLCAANHQKQARELATGIVQNDTVVAVDLSGAAPDATGATVVHVETEHFRGRHVLADCANEGTSWPGRYTLKQADTPDEFLFRTATMPADAERLVENCYDVRQHRTALPESGPTESDDEVSADD